MIADIIESMHLREQGYDIFDREVDQRTHFAVSTAPAKAGDWFI
ncbi:hypothetical protein RRH01S_02_05690 [Rhizobium rhizogenes NBRC 13257]|uniref:Uncharacterized protein n=1 Tax=Rhizobium rhizogenes NBRC 13257 TaxID=1220581 RepID=A0AA87U3J8_RHIRH|nr:hypothetical protein RRH01S_02_05690 [Rhizobium rhizogenes NBRC 13257]